MISGQINPIKPKRESAGSGRMSICQLCDSGNTMDENITHMESNKEKGGNTKKWRGEEEKSRGGGARCNITKHV